MKKSMMIMTVMVMWVNCVFAQQNEEFTPSGRIEGRIFTDFSTDIIGDSDEKAFELKRAYMGYRYQITEEFRAHVRIDVGGSEFVIEDALSQYVFFKTAALYYEKGPWFAAFGLHDTYQFKVQERLWGKRYILPSMLDRQKFDFSADVGASGQYRTDNFSVDLALFNGEGYKQLQQDNAFRGSLGATGWFADRKIIGRLYTDYSSLNIHLASLTGFIGFDLNEFTLGLEYTHQENYAYFEGHDRNAYSIFSQYNFTDRFGVWARIDGMNSKFSYEDNPDEEQASHIENWKSKDGEDIFAGIEYALVPRKINTSINYQHHHSNNVDPVDTGRIFLNLEVRF